MNLGPVLILGGGSDIGVAVAKKYASLGHPIQLAARNVDELTRTRADLEIRYRVTVTLHRFDALEVSAHDKFINDLGILPMVVVSAIGSMGDQSTCERDFSAASLVMRSNYEGPASIISAIANKFEERGGGTIVGISSVAGERGRAANYIYGSAKAGFTAFLSGLRGRMAGKGVHVVTVLPGFVATRMTEGLNLPAWLTAEPGEVAEAIEAAVRKKRNVIYVRAIWRFIMMIIRNIPESAFKNLRI